MGRRRDLYDEGGLTRRAVLLEALGAGAALVGPTAPAWASRAPRAATGCVTRFRNSLSVSPFSEKVLSLAALTDGHVTARTVRELQALFVRHGATEVYQRIATRKHAPQSPDAEHGWARGLDRARLARSLGLPFNPELGLFRSYGDAGSYQQPPDFSDYHSIRLPRPWLQLTLREMEHALRQYGELVARQILRTGVRVDVWDLGNEVEFGIAGVAVAPLLGGNGTYAPPTAVDPAIGRMSTAQLIGMSEADRIAWLRRHLWPHIGRLLAATAEGISSVSRSARFSTHISGIFQPSPAIPLAFWETVQAAGYRPSVFGTSYYPSAGGLAAPGNLFTLLKRTAAALEQRFHKPMFIAEGDYPSGHMTGSFPYNTPVPGYPQTPVGQDHFTHDLISWGVGSGHLAGYRPWAPDYCTSEWQPMSYFTAVGSRRVARSKPVLGAGLRALAGIVRC